MLSIKKAHKAKRINKLFVNVSLCNQPQSEKKTYKASELPQIQCLSNLTFFIFFDILPCVLYWIISIMQCMQCISSHKLTHQIHNYIIIFKLSKKTQNANNHFQNQLNTISLGTVATKEAIDKKQKKGYIHSVRIVTHTFKSV